MAESKNNNNTQKKKKITPKQQYYLNKKEKLHQTTIISFAAICVAAVSLGVFDYYHERSELLDQLENIAHEQNVSYNEVANEVINDIVLEQDVIEITAEELIEEYSDVETLEDIQAIREKYLGEYLEITGDVNKIYQDPFHGNSFSMRNESPDHIYSDWLSVLCYMQDDEQIELLNQLESGDEVVVKGYCVGNQAMCIGIQDCEIKEIK